MAKECRVDFPNDLIISAKSLEHLGLSELAWSWEEAIRTVEFLCKNNYSILGGDVYLMAEGSLDSTYDSWYFNRNEAKSNQQLIKESSERAIKYINEYHEMNGDDYYYSLVFEQYNK